MSDDSIGFIAKVAAAAAGMGAVVRVAFAAQGGARGWRLVWLVPWARAGWIYSLLISNGTRKVNEPWQTHSTRNSRNSRCRAA
jgi:hypothetical protein